MLQTAYNGYEIFRNRSIKRKISSLAQVGYNIRPMREEDIPGVVEITKANRFQYPVSSLHTWMKHDPEGIMVAVTDTGTVLGTCCCVKNTDQLYFGGIFSVREEYRNLEIGSKIFDQLYSRGKSENIGCNSTSDKLTNFKRRGFVVFESDWSSLEYETYEKVDPQPLSDSLPSDVELVPYRNGLFPSIAAYDRAVVGLNRTDLLELSLQEDDCVTLVALRGGACVGYGCIKMSITGTGHVGPLYADDPRVAEAMLKGLVIAMPEAKGLAMVTVSSNVHANGFMRKLGLQVEVNAFRLYTKSRLIFNTEKVYAQMDIDFSVI